MRGCPDRSASSAKRSCTYLLWVRRRFAAGVLVGCPRTSRRAPHSVVNGSRSPALPKPQPTPRPSPQPIPRPKPQPTPRSRPSPCCTALMWSQGDGPQRALPMLRDQRRDGWIWVRARMDRFRRKSSSAPYGGLSCGRVTRAAPSPVACGEPTEGSRRHLAQGRYRRPVGGRTSGADGPPNGPAASCVWRTSISSSSVTSTGYGVFHLGLPKTRLAARSIAEIDPATSELSAAWADASHS